MHVLFVYNSHMRVTTPHPLTLPFPAPVPPKQILQT